MKGLNRLIFDYGNSYKGKKKSPGHDECMEISTLLMHNLQEKLKMSTKTGVKYKLPVIRVQEFYCKRPHFLGRIN
jgi:hypothetical protein